jgi:hypothetical protein
MKKPETVADFRTRIAAMFRPVGALPPVKRHGCAFKYDKPRTAAPRKKTP